MKNLMKTLTTTLLIAALVLTNIVIPGNNVVTASAKTTSDKITIDIGTDPSPNPNGITVNITMKPGDTKKFLIDDENGFELGRSYAWKSSDKSVASAYSDFYDVQVDFTTALFIEANAPGTATIVGHPFAYPEIERYRITITVNVTFPKATKKQKKCKHKYKTTKKATCERVGIKTCKKCKFQKSIKKIPHKYVTQPQTIYTHPIEYTIFQCPRCDYYNHPETNIFCSCPNHYGSIEAAEEAAYAHAAEMITSHDPEHEGMTLDNIRVGGSDRCSPEVAVETTITICKYCGREKQNIEAAKSK